MIDRQLSKIVLVIAPLPSLSFMCDIAISHSFFNDYLQILSNIRKDHSLFSLFMIMFEMDKFGVFVVKI